MKKLILALLFPSLIHAATSYTEFYCQTTGSNLNAGSTTDNTAPFTFASGNWVQGTGVFTKAGADLSGVSAGMWASVYPDAATVAVFVGRITAVDDGADTITVSLTAKSGTAPVDGTGDTTLKVGGAWKGPNAAEGFPFNFIAATQVNAAGDAPRVNFKNNASFVITAALTHTVAGPVTFQGYTTTPGDGGKAAILDSATAASYVLLTLSGTGTGNTVADFVFSSSFSSGTSSGLAISASRNILLRVVVHDVRTTGFNITGVCLLIECEAYACNAGNSGGNAGFLLNGTGITLLRCISHDNAGANSVGFIATSYTTFLDCIADSNGSDGFQLNGSNVYVSVNNCEAYNNGGDGIDFTSAGIVLSGIINCNLIDNTGWGINTSGSAVLRGGLVSNCGFGSGTAANGSGEIATISGVTIAGSVTYAANATPWVDPANGDFRVSLAAAKGAGRGAFTQTAASYAGTVGYPDIGAAQHQDAAASGGGSFPWAQ